MKKSLTILLFLFTALFLSRLAVAYQPPIGIPDPSWGSIHPIDTTAPSQPSSWPSAASPGYYYIDNTNSNATDSSNPYGYPNKPRLTIPTATYSAGSYVEIHGGPYTNSSQTLTFNCTEANPCWFRGSSQSSMAKIDAITIQNSSYLFMENIDFDGRNTVSRSAVGITGSNTHNVVVRNSLIHNRPYVSNTAGIGIQPVLSGTVHDIVIYNNIFHDLGDWQTLVDQDYHGVNPNLWGRDSTTSEYNIWILSSTFYHVSGNGIQVNAGNWTDSYKYLNHIYIGRNIAHDNRQAGFWSKQASDVIISQNTSYNSRSHGPQPGDGVGYQYGPDYLWIIFNNLYSCNYGVRQSDTASTYIGHKVFIIGNVIHDINPENLSTYDPNDTWRQGVGISLWEGNSDRYIVDNTIYNAYGGINAIHSGNIDIHGNIIAGIHQGDYHISAQFPARENTVTMSNNLFYDSITGSTHIKWDATTFNSLASFNAATSLCPTCVYGDPQFNDAANNNFSIKNTSKATNTNTKHSAYQTFKDRYGIDIYKDYSSRPRTIGLNPDMGAYEAATILKSPEPVSTQ